MYDHNQAPALRIGRLTDMVRVLDPREHGVRDDGPVGRFRWDSRLVEPGDIFVALPGARVDGHDYIKPARDRGAAACLVSRWDHLDDKDGLILVDNTIRALGYLAASHRRSLGTKLIGITGSVGKTTTKEILATLLGGVFRTKKSEGNLNSTIGLPVQILELQETDQWMVAEMGMSTPGEIAALAQLAKPDIALWTSVRAVHLANFESIEGIARAKAELVDNLGFDKTLVYNRDDPLVTRFSAEFQGKKLSYGVREPDARIRARIEPYSDWRGVSFDLWVSDEEKLDLHLPLTGRFNVYNAIAACATAATAGVPPAELKYSLKTVRPIKRRCSLHEYDNDIAFVDDTYNANPHAVREVIRSFASLSRKTWRWLILGDMLELGEDERAIHAELGRELAVQGFDRITLIGDLCSETHRTLNDIGPRDTHIEHFTDTETALANLPLEIPHHARIWAKASRSLQLERISDHIIDHLEKAS